jgi:hypothetical protein
MDNEPFVRAFHTAIIKAATEKLGRSLSENERRFITSRGGFITLEIIEDNVKAGKAAEVEKYLNSENSV